MKLRPLNRNKKGAIELSVGTMVIIVVAVVMLVLALIFVRRIFSGATYNVDQLNDAVRAQINKAFSQESQKVAIYLPGKTASIKQDETFGVAFGLRNNAPASATFNYHLKSGPEGVSYKTSGTGSCPGANPRDWIILGDTGSFSIPSDGVDYGLIKLKPPKNAPLGCNVRYTFEVEQTGGGVPPDVFSFFFDVEIVSKGLGGGLA